MAQKILKKYAYPYLSIDLLKMGLIRSGATALTPEDDAELTAYLWPIVKEIIKTAIENRQNLVVEGIYVPCSWKQDFAPRYIQEIRYYCLIMSPNYIAKHFIDIIRYANSIEHRLDDSACTPESLLADNAANLRMCLRYGYPYILIEDEYTVDIAL